MSTQEKQESPVMKHFKDGKLPRLELSMLPRDPNRSLGTLRKVICSSFNYCKRYPAKLDLFIEVVKFAANMAMAYKAESKLGAEKVAELKAEAAKEIKEEQGDK